MIEELGNGIGGMTGVTYFDKSENVKFTYQRTLFPEPAVETIFLSFEESMKVPKKNTDVSREPTGVNLGQRVSILQIYGLESTMLPFHYVGIHERFCDFSSDLVGRAISGCLLATCHLQEQFQYTTDSVI